METLNDAALRQVLEQARVIAVVGHSDDPGRTSYRIHGDSGQSAGADD